jgi:hypothetical protein
VLACTESLLLVLLLLLPRQAARLLGALRVHAPGPAGQGVTTLRTDQGSASGLHAGVAMAAPGALCVRCCALR